jgi:hypothetical protein
MHEYDDNKIYLKEILWQSVEWILMVQNESQRRALMNTGSIKCGHFLAS